MKFWSLPRIVVGRATGWEGFNRSPKPGTGGYDWLQRQAPKENMTTLTKAGKFIWASPCSVVGIVLGTAVLLLGGKVKRAPGTLEFTYRESQASCGKLARSLAFGAITFGQVIIAVTEQELTLAREHELVHVRQYERWGVAFFLAYPASSLWQLLRGRNAYWDNHFEIQARSLSPQASG